MKIIKPNNQKFSYHVLHHKKKNSLNISCSVFFYLDQSCKNRLLKEIDYLNILKQGGFKSEVQHPWIQ